MNYVELTVDGTLVTRRVARCSEVGTSASGRTKRP